MNLNLGTRKKRVYGFNETIPKDVVIAEDVSNFVLIDGDLKKEGPWKQLPNDHCPKCGSFGHTYRQMSKEIKEAQPLTVIVCCRVCVWWEEVLTHYLDNRGRTSTAIIVLQQEERA